MYIDCMGWGYVEKVPRDEVSEFLFCRETLYHCTNKIDIKNYKVGDMIYLKSGLAFRGKGVYWSTRTETLYGKTTLVLINSNIKAEKIREHKKYKWYKTESLILLITKIDIKTRTIYLKYV